MKSLSTTPQIQFASNICHTVPPELILQVASYLPYKTRVALINRRKLRNKLSRRIPPKLLEWTKLHQEITNAELKLKSGEPSF
jgi:hypothetical protein